MSSLFKSSTWGFHAGTFMAQLANNAFIVTFPLVVLQHFGSAELLGLLLAAATACDAAGTIAGGTLLNYFSAKNLLMLTTLLRAALLALLPLLFPLGMLSIALLALVVMIDALARGIADTCRYTVPVQHTDRAATTLKRFNGTYQMAFESGSIAGPLLVGVCLAQWTGIEAHWLVAGAFVVASACYILLPAPMHQGRSLAAVTQAASATTVRRSWLLNVLALQSSLALYPIKTVLPAVFATVILKRPEAAAWIVAAFGIGGLLGAAFSRQQHQPLSINRSILLSGASTVLLATAWLPASLWWMLAAVTIFAGINVVARLQLLAHVQLSVPLAAFAGVIARLRLTTNLASTGVKFLSGMALGIASPATGFGLLGIGLVGAGALQILAGRVLSQQGELKDETIEFSAQSL